MVKNLPEMQGAACQVGDTGLILGREDPLEKEMAAHSSTIAWKIHGRRTPWTPWGLKESDMIERLHFHFLFSEYMPKSEFAGSYGSFIPKIGRAHV